MFGRARSEALAAVCGAVTGQRGPPGKGGREGSLDGGSVGLEHQPGPGGPASVWSALLAMPVPKLHRKERVFGAGTRWVMGFG